MSNYPTFRVDSEREAGDVGGACRYVIALGFDPPRPIIWKRSSGTASWMAYRNEQAARMALSRLRAETYWGDELHIYDKEQVTA